MKRTLLALSVLGLTAALASSPAVQGSGQLAGGDAQIGRTYTLYMGTGRAANFTLNKVEYLPGRFISDPGTDAERDWLREAGKKLVLVHYTVQNPQKVDLNFRYDSLRISGVDSNNQEVKWVYGSGVYDEITHKNAAMRIKPAQKINVVALLEIGSRASLPKLLVETNEKTRAVWRYNLSGKIGPVPEPYVDLSVPGGGAALDRDIPGRLNTWYPAGRDGVDFKVTDLKYSSAPVLGKTAPAGGKLLVVNVSFRNPHYKNFNVGNAFPPVRAQVYDQDGMAGGQLGKPFLYFASRDEELKGVLNGGKEIAARFLVLLPQGMDARQLEISSDSKRAFSFDLSAAR